MIHILHLNQDVKRAYVLSNLFDQRGLEYEFIITSPTSIIEAYLNVELLALANGWTHSDVIIQDDVSLDPSYGTLPEEVDSPLIVYGRQLPSGHICPKAYSATVEGHQIFANILQDPPESDKKGTVCPSFMKAVDKIGVVSQMTTEIFFAPRHIKRHVR